MNAAEFKLHYDVSRETIERLEVYAAELARWNARINLIAPSTVQFFWQRHILDSAQLLALSPKSTTKWTDLGSGGGLPGLVVAILSKEVCSQRQIICIESDKRKSVFLSTVSRQLDLNVRVLTQRIESAESTQAETLSARALAPLETLLSFAEKHLDPHGLALFPKGAQVMSEIARAKKNWRFDIETFPSKTDPQGVILRLGDIQRA